MAVRRDDWDDALAGVAEALGNTGPVRSPRGLAAVAAAENELARGRYAAAVARVRGLCGSPDAVVRLASLEVTLRALLACAGGAAAAEDGLAVAIAAAAQRLQPLVEPVPGGRFAVRAGEWEVRRERCRRLLARVDAVPPRAADAGERLLPGAADAVARPLPVPAVAAGCPPAAHTARAALAAVEEALREPAAGAVPEEGLRLRLLWSRLALQVHGRTLADSVESVLTAVLVEAHGRGLPMLEIMAADLRAVVRARCFGNAWRDAAEDAGRAADLAMEVLSCNAGTWLAAPLRARLLPVLERAVELLAAGACRWRRAAATAEAEAWERRAQAIRDQIERSAGAAAAGRGLEPAGAGEEGAGALSGGTSPVVA